MNEAVLLLELLRRVEVLLCDSAISFWLGDDLLLEWRELPDLDETRIRNGEQTFPLKELIAAMQAWAAKVKVN